MIRAVVFDLWDTLIPSTINFQRLNSLLTSQGLSLKEYIPRYERAVQLKKYKSFEGLKKDFFREFKEEKNFALEEELKEVYTKRVDSVNFFPEVKETLTKLKQEGYKLALLSNTENLFMEKFEKKIKLSTYFDAFCPSYETKALKPQKEAFECVLKKLKINPGEALMVGDSQRCDIGGSVGMKMHNCLINRSGKIIDKSRAQPEFEIKSLSEVFEVIKKINEKEN